MSDVKVPDPSVQDPQAGLPASGSPAPEAGATGTEPDKTVPLAALHEERDKRQALQAETLALKEQLDGLQRMSQFQQPSAGTQHGTVYPQQQTDPRQQINELWESDPRKALQAELMMGFQWYDQVNSQLDIQEADVAFKHPDFNQYRNDVRRYVRALSPGDRAKPGVVELAYFACRGQKVDDIVKERQQELLDKLKRGEQVQGFDYGSAAGTPPPKPKAALNEEEKKVAAAMNMTEAEYMKHKT